MNFIHIAGHIGKDAETRFTANGDKVTTLIIATNTKKKGEEVTIWWNVTLWGDRWDKLIPYLTKGKALMVGGEMNKPEIYTDKEGKPQVGSLNVNAEYVKFPPFGRTDSQTGDQPQRAEPAQVGAQTVEPTQYGTGATGSQNEEQIPF